MSKQAYYSMQSGRSAMAFGLGGSGIDGLLQIKGFFDENTAETDMLAQWGKIGYMAIDADSCSLERAQWNGLGPSETVLLPRINPVTAAAGVEFPWLDRTLFNEPLEFPDGIRQKGRLRFMQEHHSLADRLQSAIRSLLMSRGGTGTLDFVLVTSIAGATGSGIFIDLAYMIRSVMHECFRSVPFGVHALLIMPEAVNARIGGFNPVACRMLEANGYAVLKELSYWMQDAESKEEHTEQYLMGRDISWKYEKPFDEIVMLTADEEWGRMEPGEVYGRILKRAAWYVKVLAEGRLDNGALKPDDCRFNMIRTAEFGVPASLLADAGAFLLTEDFLEKMSEQSAPDEQGAGRIFEKIISQIRQRYDLAVRLSVPAGLKCLADNGCMMPADVQEFYICGTPCHEQLLGQWLTENLAAKFCGGEDGSNLKKQCSVLMSQEVQEIIRRPDRGPIYLVGMLEDELIPMMDRAMHGCMEQSHALKYHVDTTTDQAHRLYTEAMGVSAGEKMMAIILPRSSKAYSYLNVCEELRRMKIRQKCAEYSAELLRALIRDMQVYAQRWREMLKSAENLHRNMSGAPAALERAGEWMEGERLTGFLRGRIAQANAGNGLIGRLLTAMDRQMGDDGQNPQEDREVFEKAVRECTDVLFGGTGIDIGQMIRLNEERVLTDREVTERIACYEAPRCFSDAISPFGTGAEQTVALLPKESRCFEDGLAIYAEQTGSRIDCVRINRSGQGVIVRIGRVNSETGYRFWTRLAESYAAAAGNGVAGLWLNGREPGKPA